MGFRKGRRTRDQIANICWIIEKAREFQKNIYFCFIDCAKAFDCVDHNKLWKILKVMGIPDHLICLLGNLYADQKATFRTQHGKTDCFKIGKRVWQGCILSLCLFNYMQSTFLHRNAGLESRLPGDISQRQICRWYHSKWQEVKTKEPLDVGERGQWKSWLETQHKKKLRSWYPVPSLHGT